MSRSVCPFCQGDRAAVGRSRMPIAGSIRRDCLDHVVVSPVPTGNLIRLAGGHEAVGGRYRHRRSPVAEQRYAGVACCSGSWPHHSYPAPRRSAPSICPDFISGRDNPILRVRARVRGRETAGRAAGLSGSLGQTGLTSVPIEPHAVHTITGQSDRTATSSGSQSALTAALCRHHSDMQETRMQRQPLARRSPIVMGSKAGRGADLIIVDDLRTIRPAWRSLQASGSGGRPGARISIVGGPSNAAIDWAGCAITVKRRRETVEDEFFDHTGRLLGKLVGDQCAVLVLRYVFSTFCVVLGAWLAYENKFW